MTDLAGLLASFSAERRQLLEAMLAGRGLAMPQVLAPPRRPGGNRFPLSFGQQRIWLQEQAAPGSPLWSIARLLRLLGRLEAGALADSLGAAVRRHEVLRTRFELEEGLPVQVVDPPLPASPPLPTIDLSALLPLAAEREATRLAAADRRRCFDLSRGPLLRACLLRLGAQEHLLAITMHHIICDAQSSEAMLGEIAEAYASRCRGESLSPSPAVMQYADFACWQREQLQGEKREALLGFWRQQLKDGGPPLALPADLPRSTATTHRAGSVDLELPGGLAPRLRGLGRREGCTLFMVLLAAWKALLYLLTGSEDLQVGAPASHRTELAHERLLGFCLNTLVLRTRLHGDLTFVELLRRVRETALASYAHQDLPFELLVEALQPERRPGQQPLINVFFVYYTLQRTRTRLAGLTLDFVDVEGETAQFDIELRLWEDNGNLAGRLLYAADLFSATTARLVADAYQRLLGRVAADPDRQLLDLELSNDASPGGPVLLDRVLKEQRDYWLEQFQAGIPIVPLPFERPRSRRSTTRSYLTLASGWRWPPGFQAMTGGSPLLVVAALLAALQLCLRRCGAGRYVAVGTPGLRRPGDAGRPPNPVVIIATMDERATFQEILQQVRDRLEQAYARQDYPIAALTRQLRPSGPGDRLPLFEVALRMTELHQPMPDTGHQLTLHCTARPDTLSLVVELDPDRVDKVAVTRFGRQLLVLLAAGLAAPGCAVDGLPILSREAQHQALREWNDTAHGSRGSLAVHRRVAAQAVRTPDATALVCGGQHLSYRELVARASALAGDLQALGVGPEVPVGILARRSAAAFVGVLGTLEAGGVCVPLDPTLPVPRLASMVKQARVAVALVGPDGDRVVGQLVGDGLLADGRVKTVRLEAAAAGPPARGCAHLQPDSLAYVLFTSGSSGLPKGVAMTHRALANLVAWQLRSSPAGSGSRTAQFTSLGFDVSFQEIFATWCGGGTLLMVPDAARGSSRELRSYLQAEAIERLFLPFIALQQLAAVSAGRGSGRWPEAGAALREVITAGEPLRITDPVERLFRGLPACSLGNQYGPTEAHVVSQRRLSGDPALWARLPPIGRPIDNLGLYVASDAGQPLPIGMAGELYIGGLGLARGYSGRPDLTAERFVPDSFSGESGARLYRTGDLARFLANGELEVLGRRDRQIKVRGQRVEPGEIELVLSRHPRVSESVVTVREGAEAADRRLIAYVVAADPPMPTEEELLDFLRKLLPAPLVPSQLMLVESLPRTATGKLDLMALPPAPAADRDAEMMPIRTPTERAVGEVWCHLLGRSRVAANDDFWKLGGNSLLAARVLFELQERCGVELEFGLLLAAPTVAAMAQAIDERLGAAGPEAAGERPAAEHPDLRQDAALDPEIRPRTARAPRPPQRILLTGASGFLGCFLLWELLARTRAEIVCLVRAQDDAAAGRRLERGLRGYGLLGSGTLSPRVLVVAGDLALPRLGLAPERLYELGERLEAIIHNGALVNMSLPYVALRPANVTASVEILRLACLGRTKMVHFVSSAGVLQAAAAGGEDEWAVRPDDPLDHPLALRSGYGQSKWVAERLMLAAWRRGLPVSVVRPGRLAGHSTTGACQPDDFFWRLVKACIQAGCVPEVEGSVELLPVDLVSREIAAVALREESLGRAFHLRGGQPLAFGELVAFMRGSGYRLQTVSVERWKDALRALPLPPDENAAYPLLPLLEQRPSPPPRATEPVGAAAGASTGWLDGGEIRLPEVSLPALLEAHFSYFIRTGFLPRPPDPGSPGDLWAG